jgi:hypothetical protein
LVLSWIYLFFPPYALGNGLLNMSRNQVFSDVMDSLATSSSEQATYYKMPLGWDVLGINLCFLVAETIFFFTLNLVIEFRMARNW